MKFTFNSSEKNVEFCNLKSEIQRSVAIQFKHHYIFYDFIFMKTAPQRLLSTNFHTITHQLNTYKFKAIESNSDKQH